MLSFTKGDRDIAIILGGKYNKKVLHIYDEKEDKKNYSDSESDDEYEDEYIEDEYPVELVGDDFYKKKLNKRLDFNTRNNDIERIRKALLTGDTRNLSRKQLEVYNQAKTQIAETCKKELKLEKGELFPLPQKIGDQIEHIYIAGPTGSGKTTWTANYIRFYKRMFPGQPVWVFSRLDKDKALDRYKVRRVVLDKGILKHKIQAKDLVKNKSGALAIFDDIDTIPDKDINKEIHRLRDDLLEVGRHDNVSVISTGHQLMDYKKTRNLLNEASAVTIFPRSGSSYHITRFLRVYCGMNTAQTQKILSLPSRWVTVYKTYPNYVLYSQGAILL